MKELSMLSIPRKSNKKKSMAEQRKNQQPIISQARGWSVLIRGRKHFSGYQRKYDAAKCEKLLFVMCILTTMSQNSLLCPNNNGKKILEKNLLQIEVTFENRVGPKYFKLIIFQVAVHQYNYFNFQNSFPASV